MNERSNSFLYGKGVFTTIAIRDGLPILWEKHWARLRRDADTLDIDLSPLNEATVAAHLAGAIANDSIATGRARITIADVTSSPLWPSEDLETQVSVIVGTARETPRPFRITTSPHLINSTSPLAGVKSCNYLDTLLSQKHARTNGYEEAVRTNERGYITSACLANVFWLSGNELFTPALSTGCLPGTTREYIFENLTCLEVEAGVSDLQNADAIYLTSAGLGIVAVDEYDGRKLADRDHQILDIWPPA